MNEADNIESQVSDCGLTGQPAQILAGMCRLLEPHMPAAGRPVSWVELSRCVQSVLGPSLETDELCIPIALSGMGFGFREAADWPGVWEASMLGATVLEHSWNAGQSWKPVRMDELTSMGLPPTLTLKDQIRLLLDYEAFDWENAALSFFQGSNDGLEVFYAATLMTWTVDYRSRAVFGPLDYVTRHIDKTATVIVPNEALQELRELVNSA